MLLVAGGQLDPNLGRLLRRALAREVPFRELLVGPDLMPQLRWDLDTGVLELDGAVLRPGAVFLRHDVFQTQQSGGGAAALNWHHAVKGWASTHPSVRLFNRHAGRDPNKIETLAAARRIGLSIPRSWVTNVMPPARERTGEMIRKPVAGGEYTILVDAEDSQMANQPYFVQQRLRRPELRVFRIGARLIAFSLTSPDLDYRERQSATLEPIELRPDLVAPLFALCEQFGLDFAAADLMEDDAGAPVFLELNSQPMFAAFDKVVEGAICDAILDHLCSDETHLKRPKEARRGYTDL